jgi:L,D-peptidoglycan transpeptidase YkuD (ErfK/YbiS/YcfS/YnhG family)
VEFALNGAAQLVAVKCGGGEADVFFFESGADGSWAEKIDMRAKAKIGAGGASADKREGDKATPMGLFRIGQAFYIGSAPQTGLDMFQITEDTFWVDDPGSRHYNRRVEGVEDRDWDSAEHMIDYENSYKCGFAIEYNADCVPGIGSAIFFHIGANSTAGCVAVSEEAMLKYLSALDAAKNPFILII